MKNVANDGDDQCQFSLLRGKALTGMTNLPFFEIGTPEEKPMLSPYPLSFQGADLVS